MLSSETRCANPGEPEPIACIASQPREGGCAAGDLLFRPRAQYSMIRANERKEVHYMEHQTIVGLIAASIAASVVMVAAAAETKNCANGIWPKVACDTNGNNRRRN